jgi:hypothetical protein
MVGLCSGLGDSEDVVEIAIDSIVHCIYLAILATTTPDECRQAFPGVFINNIQYPESLTILSMFFHEIVTPVMVFVLRP